MVSGGSVQGSIQGSTRRATRTSVPTQPQIVKGQPGGLVGAAGASGQPLSSFTTAASADPAPHGPSSMQQYHLLPLEQFLALQTAAAAAASPLHATAYPDPHLPIQPLAKRAHIPDPPHLMHRPSPADRQREAGRAPALEGEASSPAFVLTRGDGAGAGGTGGNRGGGGSAEAALSAPDNYYSRQLHGLLAASSRHGGSFAPVPEPSAWAPGSDQLRGGGDDFLPRGHGPGSCVTGAAGLHFLLVGQHAECGLAQLGAHDGGSGGGGPDFGRQAKAEGGFDRRAQLEDPRAAAGVRVQRRQREDSSAEEERMDDGGGTGGRGREAAALASGVSSENEGLCRDGLQSTRLKGQHAIIQQTVLLHAITQAGAAELSVHEIFTFWRPETRSCRSAKLKHLTSKQHDILYALSGCEDVLFQIGPVSGKVRHALEELYGISKGDLQMWFKNRERKPRPQKPPGQGGSSGIGRGHLDGQGSRHRYYALTSEEPCTTAGVAAAATRAAAAGAPATGPPAISVSSRSTLNAEEEEEGEGDNNDNAASTRRAARAAASAETATCSSAARRQMLGDMTLSAGQPGRLLPDATSRQQQQQQARAGVQQQRDEEQQRQGQGQGQGQPSQPHHQRPAWHQNALNDICLRMFMGGPSQADAAAALASFVSAEPGSPAGYL